MNASRIIIHSFTYAGDAELAEENTLCIRHAIPEAKVVIIDDFNNPCPESIRRKLEELGVEWRVSYWNRNGNLRGSEAILGIVSEMLASSENDNDILVKIDPDTALLEGKEILSFANGTKIIWGSSSNDCPMHGCAYAIKAHALKKAEGILSLTNIPLHAPEDRSIANAIMYLFPDKNQHDLSHPCSKKHPDSVWAGYHWGCYPNVTSYDKFSVIVTGNRPEPPLTRSNRVDVMRALRLARSK